MSAQMAEPSDDSQSPLGRHIRVALRRQRMTLDDLATAIGVHRSTLSRWLAGQAHPSPANFAALESALGVRFMDDDDDAGYRLLDAAPEPPAPAAATVVVIVAATAEAMNAALDRAGVPRAQ